MIKNIVFDIGNVLTDFRWQDAIHQCGFAPEVEEQLGQLIFQGPWWKEYDRGVMRHEEVTARIHQDVDAVGLGPEMDKLYEGFFDLVIKRDYAAPLLRAVRAAGLGAYILSNYGKKGFEYNIPRFDFLREADGELISYRVQLLKPDPAIYRLFLETFGLQAEECLFLDDTLENVEGARSVGMYSEQVSDLPGILAAIRARAGVAVEL